MSLVFYYAPWSSASTCLWALEELGIPHERVKLDLKAKDTQKPAFLALNPNGKVPLLVHDGVPIFESIAILAHLGETFGVEKKLFPAPGLDRAKAFQWLAWANVSIGAAAGRYLCNSSDDAKEETMKLFGMLDDALANKTWLVGDSFTLADLHLAGLVGWLSTVAFDLKSLANIQAWSARCQARPAFAAVRASGG